MTCTRKHTLYQPTDEEWKCPSCGSDASYFAIDVSSDNAWETLLQDNCELLHEDDLVNCWACEKAWSGKSLSKTMKKKKQTLCFFILLFLILTLS